jgi:ABC-2 type transport system ATP-binding protein/ABC-2 type transport system permease protein
MPQILEEISNFLPLSYAVDATKKVLIGQGSITNDFLIMSLFLVFLLGAGSLTLRRTTK